MGLAYFKKSSIIAGIFSDYILTMVKIVATPTIGSSHTTNYSGYLTHALVLTILTEYDESVGRRHETSKVGGRQNTEPELEATPPTGGGSGDHHRLPPEPTPAELLDRGPFV